MVDPKQISVVLKSEKQKQKQKQKQKTERKKGVVLSSILSSFF